MNDPLPEFTEATAKALDATDELKCPNCAEPFRVKRSVTLPPEQRMSFTITHEHPLLSARTVYGTIKEFEALMRATAQSLGADCHVFLEGIDWQPGRLRIDFFIADHDVQKKARRASDRNPKGRDVPGSGAKP